MLQNEVTGDSDGIRGLYFIFTPKRTILERKKDPEFGGHEFTVDKYPIEIIKNYKVGIMRAEGNKATDTVIYSRIARADEESIAVDRKDRDTVIYHLVKRKNKWQVIDPPPAPHVLLESMLSIFTELVTHIPGKSDKKFKPTKLQKKMFPIVKRKLAQLEQLK
jgi:hypothetical protein